MSSKDNLLELPLRYAWKHLNTASQILGSMKCDPRGLDLNLRLANEAKVQKFKYQLESQEFIHFLHRHT